MDAAQRGGELGGGGGRATTDAYPLTEACAWTKLPGGWAISFLRIQGPDIVETELLSDGVEPRADAAQRLTVETVARFAAAANSRGVRG